MPLIRVSRNFYKGARGGNFICYGGSEARRNIFANLIITIYYSFSSDPFPCRSAHAQIFALATSQAFNNEQ